MQIRLILLLLSFLPYCAIAQNLTQTIRGKVTDADTGQPLVGATVQLIENQTGAVTDSAGNYRLENIPVGRYQIQASYIGYQALTIAEILLESGREVIQNIELSEQATQVDEVVVRASREMTQPVSVKTLTIEEVLRFPATFYDPARLATAFAGVAGDNDQANGISVRGNSPNGLLWRLEGVDIVNPNHTPNAGTFSDRVTANGGGVNILSAQMLGTSTFYSGAFPAEYGNALSAVMDMRLRTGNDQKHETIAQIGLIGIDVANEGPFSKKGGASYLFNARYSTVGLLGALGLDFGGETINFYDLSFNLNFPFKNGARLTFFGMGGNSENIFKAERDSSVWEFQKDRFDINFKSSMGALGATYTQPVGKQAIWRTALAYSILDSERTGDRLGEAYRPERVEENQYLQRKLSLHTFLNFKQNARSTWQLGAVSTQHHYDIATEPEYVNEIKSGNASGILFQPYASWRYQWSRKIIANLGVHFSHFTQNQTNTLEPRASLSWSLSPRHNLSLAYSLQSQWQQPHVLFARNTPNQFLGYIPAHHIVLGYRTNWRKSNTISAELYYQHLFKVPVSVGENSFSILNEVEFTEYNFLESSGTGRNYGIELSYQKFITDDFYLLSNITLYESKYTGSDGIERDTRWNGNYIFNATAGKEWRWAQKGGNINAVLGLNGRVVYLGGFRDTPIEARASSRLGETIYNNSLAFTIQQKAYFRTDLRFYYKRNKPKYSTTLALDIQNATNAQNVAFSYYDLEKQEIVVKNQLGLIPLLSWRIEF